RAFDKGSERIECADASADIGAAGDDGLLGFAGALSVENLQHEAVLLEEAGILPELGKRILPRSCQSRSDAQFVLRDGITIDSDKKREDEHCQPETRLDHVPSSTSSGQLNWRELITARRRRGRRAGFPQPPSSNPYTVWQRWNSRARCNIGLEQVHFQVSN